MAIEIHLLGAPDIRIDGRPVDVGHDRQQCVLVALAVQGTRPISLEQLADRVWGEHRPQRAHGTLQSYLCRLRRILAPATDADISRCGVGYVLDVDPMAVDLHHFRDLLAAARRSVDDTDTAELFAEALRMWRGEPFGNLDTPWLNTMRESLKAERLAAELDRNDVALRLGRHVDLVDALCGAATGCPWDERLAAQLMLALYGCGRQSEALQRYEDMRRRLADELGADPSPPLRLLHQQILCSDPALAASSPVNAAPVPRQLPALSATFEGRTAELTELTKIMSPESPAPTTVVVSAIGGIGKTWLALRWASEQVDRFPDGQLYVNLRGFDPSDPPVTAAQAIRGFLAALGVDPAQVPITHDAQSALYRTLVAGRRMLIVLDNARDTGTVAPLLPGTATCAVLVTSRRRLGALMVAHGAHPLALDALPDAEARELLARRLGGARMAAGGRAVDEILRHCAGLPLALDIVAARAVRQPDLPLAGLAAELGAAARDAWRRALAGNPATIHECAGQSRPHCCS